MTEVDATRPEPLSVVLQHGNRAFRELLAGYLRRDPDISLKGFAALGSELVQLCQLQRPAVIVFEADAPRWSNERLITQLRSSGRRVRIVGLHESLPAQNVIRAYRAGVNALVTYSSGLDQLVAAVQAPSLVETAKTKRGRSALTERELDVLSLISSGYQAEHAAWQMGITLNTLEHHKRQIFAKLAVHDQAHAAASAVRLGLSRRPSRTPAANNHLAVDGPGVRVLLRGPEGDVVDLVRKILEQAEIAVVTEAEPPLSDAAGVVTVAVVDDDEWAQRRPAGPQASVVVMTGEVKRTHLAEAWSRGASLVPSCQLDDLLVTAVRAAAQSYLMVDAAHSRAILGRMRMVQGDGSTPWLLALTPREREILAHIAHGHAMKQTARLLGISVRTVENLQSNLFRKLRVHDRTAALAAAYELGLLDDLSGGDSGTATPA